jgi:hypothetical protein
MIRVLSIVSSACLALAIILALIDAERYVVSWILLLLVAFGIGAFLGLRRGYKEARKITSAAQSFVTGDVQHARIAEVGEPEGFFTPTANLVLELEGEDGAVHRFDREVPVPFPLALSYRLGRRFKIPIIGREPLTEMMALELRREGLDIDLSWRPPPGLEIIDGPVQPGGDGVVSGGSTDASPTSGPAGGP